MTTKTVNISETLYRGLGVIKLAMPEYTTMDSLVEKAVEDFLTSQADQHKTTAHNIQSFIDVYRYDKTAEENE